MDNFNLFAVDYILEFQKFYAFCLLASICFRIVMRVVFCCKLFAAIKCHDSKRITFSFRKLDRKIHNLDKLLSMFCLIRYDL